MFKGLSHVLLIVTFLASYIFVDAQTCYVTKTGSKYHMPSCSYLKYSKIAYKFDEIKEAGYTACSRCKPTKAKLENVAQAPQNVVAPVKNASPRRVNSVQCSGKTRSGIRCKRKTKNANGYCYQHG